MQEKLCRAGKIASAATAQQVSLAEQKTGAAHLAGVVASSAKKSQLVRTIADQVMAPSHSTGDASAYPILPLDPFESVV